MKKENDEHDENDENDENNENHTIIENIENNQKINIAVNDKPYKNTKKYTYCVAYNTNNMNIKQLVELAFYENLHNAFNHLYILYKLSPDFFYLDYHIITYIIENNKYECINKIYRIKNNNIMKYS